MEDRCDSGASHAVVAANGALEDEEAHIHDHAGSWAARMCHRYNPIGGSDIIMLQRQRRRQWRWLVCMSCCIAVLLFQSERILPARTAMPQVPDPPNGSCGWERLEAWSARVCASDSEQSAWVRCAATSRTHNYHTAAAPAWRCMNGTVRSLLVGPFRSRVQEWHSITITAPLLRRGDRIVRFTGGAVRAYDAITAIGYPPVHVHHLHVHHALESHFFETHGDYLSASSAQHPAYNMYENSYSLSSPPAGTCVVQDDAAPIEVDAQINDVRFSTGTAMAGEPSVEPSADRRPSAVRISRLEALRAASPPLTWYLRIAFDVQSDSGGGSGHATALPPPCTPVHKLILGYPLDEHALADPLLRFDAGNRETLFTWTLTLPVSGRLAQPAWLHAHRARYGGYLLLRGAHSVTELLSMQGDRRGALDNLRGSLPPSNRTATVRAILLERAMRNGSLLCHDDPAEPTFVARAERGDGLGGIFDRQGRVVCEPFAFGASEVLTAVYLSRPVWATDLVPFPQHAQLAFYYTLDAKASSGDDGAAKRVPLIQVLQAQTYTVIDLDGTLEGARSRRCVQPSPWALWLRLSVGLSSHVIRWIPFFSKAQRITCEEV